MKRRLLLQGLIAILGATRATADAIRPLPRASQLSGAELQTLVAYGEVLVESRELSSAERGYLVEHIEQSVREHPETVARYKTTARLLDRLARARFATLDLDRRRALVTRHRLDARPVGGEDPADETLDIRTRVLPDLIEGYWASPAGWAAVGYTTFPGRCGDLARYTRPEA